MQPPFLTRMLTEYEELVTKLNACKDFLVKVDGNGVHDDGTQMNREQVSLLRNQYNAMYLYADMLSRRINLIQLELEQ